MQNVDLHFWETQEADIQMEHKEEKLLDAPVNENEELTTTLEPEIQKVEREIDSQHNVVQSDGLSSEQEFSVSIAAWSGVWIIE